MSDTLAAPDVDVRMSVDESPRCQWLNPDCSQTASWIAHLDCGCHYLACDAHRREAVELGVAYARLGMADGSCLFCHRPCSVFGRWEPI
jgi:hypothetical protein